jgi:hypothetical protein
VVHPALQKDSSYYQYLEKRKVGEIAHRFHSVRFGGAFRGAIALPAFARKNPQPVGMGKLHQVAEFMEI